ncbi:MAG: hypothetical protein OXP73_00225, partial [Chloroflexota bacterium]|nr:hypothetical protein [Chloroflexota bacterium]
PLEALEGAARPGGVRAAGAGGGRAARTLVKVKAAADAEDRGLALLAPAWSPDGTRLAFAAADADGTLGIYVVATDGTRPVWLHDLRPLVTDAVSAPAWSPDGTRLAYAKTVDDVLGLYAVAADGTDEREIIGIDFWQRLWRHGRPRPRHVGLVRDVAWSPDGTRLLYVYGAATCVVAENGALLGRALLSPEFPESPEYGRWDCVLTSTGESEHPWPAWVRDRPPGWYHEHGVYKDAESVAAWSPDGERIAFTRTIGMFEDDDVDYPDGMGISLFIMAPDGSGTWQVAFINALGPALRRPPTGDDGSAG